MIFQSTPPVKGVTLQGHGIRLIIGISIHTPCEGGDVDVSGCLLLCDISIHTPCEGGDTLFFVHCAVFGNFNPHPL